MTGVLGAVVGCVIVLGILWEVFESLVLPRRVARRFRFVRLFYRTSWPVWSAIALRIPGERREGYLSVFGPLSLLFLFGAWAIGLVSGFALLQWAGGSQLNDPTGTSPGLATDFYMSGTTFFTLGLGDVTPRHTLARWLTIIEAGTGFGFLALVIGYLPTLYQAFSRRETNISLLDARAGSPPSAGELLRRHAGDMEGLDLLLRNWELWAAELMESHVSYPVLGYYRSQHDNQSWLTALTTVLDTAALVVVGLKGDTVRQARLTFAMARHAVVDLAQVYDTPPRAPENDRLPLHELRALRASLAEAGVPLRDDDSTERALEEMRHLYEPYVAALARRLLLPLPAWYVTAGRDNWRSSAWEQ